MRSRSLRLRITGGALVIVVAGLTVAGFLVIRAVQREMVRQIDTALRADADFTQRMMTHGSGLPVGEGPTDLYVQFVAHDGRVVGSGTAAAGLPALTGPTSRHGSIVDGAAPHVGRLRVLAEPAPGDPGLTLVLARSSQNVADVHDALVRLLLVLLVVGSMLLGVLVWLIVGRALQPVDEIRRRVDDLGDRNLAQRLELPGTGDELDRLVETINDLLVRLDQAVTREQRFVADASHELRTPITALRALLESEAADPELIVLTRADALGRLNQLQDLVEALLVLARMDEGVVVEDSPVDLDELVLGQARQLARGSVLSVDTTRVSGGQVSGRDVDFGRLVENLASNASRYAVTRVSFAVLQIGERVQLRVDDDGPGVPVELRERVFERFSTIDDPGSDGRAGTGLGLSIAASIVAAHGGTIRVTDAPGGGARFEVELPAYAPKLVLYRAATAT